jgi:hypothetical protein
MSASKPPTKSVANTAIKSTSVNVEIGRGKSNQYANVASCAKYIELS